MQKATIGQFSPKFIEALVQIVSGCRNGTGVFYVHAKFGGDRIGGRKAAEDENKGVFCMHVSVMLDVPSTGPAIQQSIALLFVGRF